MLEDEDLMVRSIQGQDTVKTAKSTVTLYRFHATYQNVKPRETAKFLPR